MTEAVPSPYNLSCGEQCPRDAQWPSLAERFQGFEDTVGQVSSVGIGNMMETQARIRASDLPENELDVARNIAERVADVVAPVIAESTELLRRFENDRGEAGRLDCSVLREAPSDCPRLAALLVAAETMSGDVVELGRNLLGGGNTEGRQ